MAASDINHIVVLMLENRSFDHMLGWLQSASYDIDGVDGSQLNRDSSGEPTKVTNDAAFSGDYDPDVAHDFDNVTQQIFGTKSPALGAIPDMSGFVTSYEGVSHSASKARRVMKCFDPKKVPVISTLAQQYALCTRWFSSVPGPTLPNRAYVHGATSVGHVDMTINWWKETRTVYELLSDHNFTAKIYYNDSTITLTYGGLLSAQERYFVPDFKAFFDDCKNNNLPNYCFLEPRYNATVSGQTAQAASDQHPDHDVSEGESLILAVYNAIRSNPDTWNSTLLAIVYDEHGGLYDHVKPPPAVSPDLLTSTTPFFAFDRLGVRVPAILVSPYIEAGTIIKDTVFDHTSLIATARKMFIGRGWEDTALTERDRAAATFEAVLTRTSPRSAKEVDPTQSHKLQLQGHTLSLKARAAEQAARPLTEHQQALTAVMASAAAMRMTQQQAGKLHQLAKSAVHGSSATQAAGG